MEGGIRRYKVLRFKRGLAETVEDEVAVEAPVEIYVNGRLLTVLYATPQDIEALAVGHLMTEGLLKNPEHIAEVKVVNNKAYVKTSDMVEDRIKAHKVRVVRTPCGQPPDRLLTGLDRLAGFKVPSDICWRSEDILNAMRLLNASAEVYRKTGGVHVALILDDAGFKVVSEDVGRHNALDKVVGLRVLKGLTDFSHTLLVCSGRLSSEIVLKSARVGIPIVASISAPTSLGLDLAERLGVTVVGFVRGGRFNVYTHSERIADFDR